MITDTNDRNSQYSEAMITETYDANSGQKSWLIRPNRSMTWREAKIFIAGVAFASLSIGFYFLWLGYPMVLPFSGLEALAVGVAFYLVLDASEYTEVVIVSESRITIESGKREMETSTSFERAWSRILLQSARNNWYPSRLLIGSHGNFVEIGRFLSEGERKALAKMLINVTEKNR